MMSADNQAAPKSQKMSDQKSNKELAKEIFFNEPHNSKAYLCGLPPLKALDNAILILMSPQIVLSMLGKPVQCGWLADAVCSPCTLSLTGPVALGTLLYDCGLFAKKKTEQCMEKKAPPANVLKQPHR